MNDNTAIEKQNPQGRPNQVLSMIQGGTHKNPLLGVSKTDLEEVAGIFIQSGMFSDVKSASQAMVKIMAGAELGFSPIISMTGVHFFQGKPSLSSNLVASLIKDSGKYEYKITKHSAEECEIAFYQHIGGELKPLGVPVLYTLNDAKLAKLTDKDVWKKFPKDMLFARAITQGARRYCADIFRGTAGDTDGDNVDEVNTGAMDAAAVTEAAPVPAAASTQVIEGEIVDTTTGEVIESGEDEAERSAIESDSSQPLFSEDEAALIDLRTAATDAYNTTKGEARNRANKWLGDKTIGQLDKAGLNAFLEAFPAM